MEWILSVYIGASIFGVGVTIADLVGAFSSLTEGGSDDGDGDAADDADADGGDDADADVDGGDSDGGVDGEDGGDEGEDADEGGDDDSHPSVVAHDIRRRKGLALRMVTTLRSLVYFSVGFGPVGWFATTQYSNPVATLAWSVPVGVIVLVLARGLRRLFRKDLSSDIKMTDLIMEAGEVIVSIGSGQMGKARISVGGVYVERFARAKDGQTEIPVGSKIRVVDVDQECVFVEQE